MADERQHLTVARIEHDRAPLIDIERFIDRFLQVNIDRENHVFTRNRIALGNDFFFHPGSAIDNSQHAAWLPGQNVVRGGFD
ncbi:MAG TPA: hypothetical protein VKB09_00880, partial [Thermomicrobiales bacterium]|nr:hypothetical protein [Thermomicrobiales bacterium]